MSQKTTPMLKTALEKSNPTITRISETAGKYSFID
jgi:hypothetical protein